MRCSTVSARPVPWASAKTRSFSSSSWRLSGSWSWLPQEQQQYQEQHQPHITGLECARPWRLHAAVSAIRHRRNHGPLCMALAKFAIRSTVISVTTMNVSLPDELKQFVDAQVGAGGFGSTSEYVRDLIRRAQDRAELRTALLEGAASPIAADAQDFVGSLRSQIADA